MASDQKWLIITEKPSVAADISKALGGFQKLDGFYESKAFTMTWAVGHLLELLAPEDLDPKYKRWLLQDLPIIPQEFQYKPKPTQLERLNLIKELAKRKDTFGFVNACDAGREGELIFREIYDFCGLKKPIRRLWLQSMTLDAIKSEFTNLKSGDEFNPLADAARCRSESDWLIGMNATRALTRRLSTRNQGGSAWSVGRVQTPTLALLVRRELEILKHRPEPFWTFEGRFSTQDHEYSGFWFDPDFKKAPHSQNDAENQATIREKDDRVFEKLMVNRIQENIEKFQKSAVATEQRKESKEIAPQLFDLTTLQREANSRFSMSASRTLQAAQRLYEKYKLITYPRTDSKYLPSDYEVTVQDVLKHVQKEGTGGLDKVAKSILSSPLKNKERVFNDKKISDHFAIIPTGEAATKLEGDDERIYTLILRRFLAAFMPVAIWDKVERITKVGPEHFRTKVQDLRVPGWREVYGMDAEEHSRLPILDKPQVNVIGIETKEEKTKPASRMSEAKLLSLMESCGKTIEDETLADALKERGIGTPATRSEIIENLIGKEYVLRNGKNLRPTTKAMRLLDIISSIPVSNLSSVELTGEMEADLKKIEKGGQTRKNFMERMASLTCEVVEKTKGFDFNTIYGKREPLGSCPKCKQGKVLENFWSYRCSQFPECDFIVWKERNQQYLERSLIQDCLTGKRIGPVEFVGMGGSSYPVFLEISTSGLVVLDENGKVIESSSADKTVISEERVEKSFLGPGGRFIETNTSFSFEFDAKEAETKIKKPSRKSKSTEGKEASSVKKKEVKKKKQLIARMPKVLCGRPMSKDDFLLYITEGYTPPILDFTSKKGRKFGAQLHMKQNANFEFKFISLKSKDKDSEKSSSPKTKAAKGTKGKAKVVRINKTKDSNV